MSSIEFDPLRAPTKSMSNPASIEHSDDAQLFQRHLQAEHAKHHPQHSNTSLPQTAYPDASHPTTSRGQTSKGGPTPQDVLVQMHHRKEQDFHATTEPLGPHVNLSPTTATAHPSRQQAIQQSVTQTNGLISTNAGGNGNATTEPLDPHVISRNASADSLSIAGWPTMKKSPASSAASNKQEPVEENGASPSIVVSFNADKMRASMPVSLQKTQTVHADQTAFILKHIRDQVIARVQTVAETLPPNRTVTLQLSPQLLADTNVQFALNDAQQLAIQFASNNHKSLEFLQANHVDLQAYLQTELTHYKSIKVSVQSQLSQPHDGRSRNRFDGNRNEEFAANA